VLKIHEQSMTMLMMLTKNAKIAHKRRVREPKSTRAATGKFEQDSNSRPQNGQIMRKRNQPNMSNFPNYQYFHRNSELFESVVIDTCK